MRDLVGDFAFVLWDARWQTLLAARDALGVQPLFHQQRGSRLVVLSPASHFGNRDQPEAWNRTVLEYLARCDRRARG